MPVVEKIGKIECLSENEIFDTYYLRTFGMVDVDGNFMVRVNRFALNISKSFIEATWLAVIEFISWYNKQSK